MTGRHKWVYRGGNQYIWPPPPPPPPSTPSERQATLPLTLYMHHKAQIMHTAPHSSRVCTLHYQGVQTAPHSTTVCTLHHQGVYTAPHSAKVWTLHHTAPECVHYTTQHQSVHATPCSVHYTIQHTAHANTLFVTRT